MMDKASIVAALQEMADILEITGANPFQIMAYRNGASILDEFEGALEDAVRHGTLTELPGIGKGLSSVISELHLTGESAERARVRALVPPGLPELLHVPRLGPKRIRRLHRELGVENLDSLEDAARGERIRGLKGFGAQTESGILRGIAWLRERRRTGS